MDRFIELYSDALSGTTDAAKQAMLDRIRTFIEEHELDDFESDADFADRLLGELEKEWSDQFTRPNARAAITRSVRSIYQFYRVSDPSPFGDNSPIQVRFGGADEQAIQFLDELDNFHFSKFADNTSKNLRQFFRREFFENGAAIFGPGNVEQNERLRQALGERAATLTNHQLETIAATAVQRTRNWAHIETMHEAGFEWAEVVAILDSRTSGICQALDGKLFNVGVAHDAIQQLRQLSPEQFVGQSFDSDIGRAFSKRPVQTANSVVDVFRNTNGKKVRIIDDKVVIIGLGFPPYHPNCRSRGKAVFGFNTDFTPDPVNSLADDVENSLKDAGFGIAKRLENKKADSTYLIVEGPNGFEKIRVSDHDESPKRKPALMDFRPGDKFDPDALVRKVEDKIGRP